ncbi:MAG TPA: phage holin family protein [Polyangia bacterium]
MSRVAEKNELQTAGAALAPAAASPVSVPAQTRQGVNTLSEAQLANLSTKDLLGRIADEVKELVTVEVQLAKAEVKADLREEITMAKGLGAGALLGYAGIILLLVAAAFGLANVMAAWAAALVVAGTVLVAAAGAAAFGWSKRVKHPLGATRRQVTETMEWAKGRAP